MAFIRITASKDSPRDWCWGDGNPPWRTTKEVVDAFLAHKTRGILHRAYQLVGFVHTVEMPDSNGMYTFLSEGGLCQQRFAEGHPNYIFYSGPDAADVSWLVKTVLGHAVKAVEPRRKVRGIGSAVAVGEDVWWQPADAEDAMAAVRAACGGSTKEK